MTANQELINFLGQYVTGNKQQKMAEALEQRTRHLTVMLEDIYQPHNASACLRSCDCLGVQDVHIVERKHVYRPNRGVALGSSKWLSIQRYHTTLPCIETLKARGYQLVATTPNLGGHDLTSLPLDRPIALLMGTEEDGLSEEALTAADMTLQLPMYGFTQSFNISVTVAIAVSRLIERIRSENIEWRISKGEKQELTLEWYRRVIKRHELLEEEFWKEQN